MKGGREFPPLSVVFDGSDYWLWDGFHRRWSAVEAKIAKLKCIVTKGTRDDARWLSYGANKDHGLQRTNDDKRRAVLAALKHPNGAKQSNLKVAEHVGVDEKTVAKYRLQLTPEIPESPDRIGRDGRTINTTNIGKRIEKEPPPEQITRTINRKVEVTPDDDEAVLRDAELMQRANQILNELEGIATELGISIGRAIESIRAELEP